MANPTPRADGLRAMREAKFDASQRRMKDEAAKAIDRPTTKVATPKPKAKKIGRKRG